jgi:hypothetical protein
MERTMAEIKTKKNAASVTDFLDSVANETRRADAKAVLKLMKKATGKQPKMWGGAIVGFDEYHYQYASGHEGEMCMVGFSPRSSAMVLYTLIGSDGEDALLKKLGKHKRSKGCLYINKLADVDVGVLEQLVRESHAYQQARYPKGK